ncbi:MAG: CHASE2 domain-containing protein [Phycisphaerales bacterium]
MKRATAMARWQSRVGFLATAVVLFAFVQGYTDRFEWITLDWRANYFAKANAQPSDKIALVGIDDVATQTVARWPWPRRMLAEVIDELRIAGTRVVALDLLLDDPSGERVVPAPPNPNAVATDRDKQDRFYETLVERIKDDELLAAAIKRHGSVIVAGRFKLTGDGDEPPPDPAANETKPERPPTAAAGEERRARTVTVGDIFKAAEDLRAAEEATGQGPQGVSIDDRRRLENDVILLRPDARERLGAQLLGAEFLSASRGGEIETFKLRFDQAYVLAQRGADSALTRPSLVAQSLFGNTVPFAMSIDPSPPVRVLGVAAARLGNVTFDSFDGDDKVRRVPLWLEYHGRLWPNLGLAAAMQYEKLPLSAVTVGPETTYLEMPDGEFVKIPTMQNEQKVGKFQGLHYISWPRGQKPDSVTDLKGWEWQFFNETLYTSEASRRAREAEVSDDPVVQSKRLTSRSEFATVSAGICYEPALLNERAHENLVELGAAATTVLVPMGVLEGEARGDWEFIISQLATMDFRETQTVTDWGALREQCETLAADLRRHIAEEAGLSLQAVGELVGDGSEAGYRRALGLSYGREIMERPEPDRSIAMVRFENWQETLRVLREAPRQIDKAIANIAEVRRELTLRLNGRIVFFGYIATGAIADFVTTSIDSKTPGVLLHAAVANAVLTGDAKRPWWVVWDLLLVAGFGIMGTYIGVRSDVVSGPVVIAGVIVGWYYFNGFVCWRGYDIIASIGGPGVAALTAGAVVFLHRFFIESRDRRRVEDRFKAYVAPDVVDELVNNPELASMVPLQRDMTVMFTDVADFTTTSERLGPVRLAQFLDKYLGEMTKILQANRGTRDKYLGDGIMCFWNAPREDLEHAHNACITAVKMLMRVDEMNDAAGFGDAGRILVRIGIATGSLMVGDFGNPPVNSSYTVLGDTANLSSRLEGANKFFGSRILVNQRTKEAAGEGLRWRPIGKVNVKGKKEAETLWELVGDLAPHGPATDEWIAATQMAVTAYQAGNLDEAWDAFENMARRFGDKKMAEIYHDSITLWRARPDRDEAFDGSIVLTEK